MHSEIKGITFRTALRCNFSNRKHQLLCQTNLEGVDIADKGKDESTVAADSMDAWE